MRVTSFAFVAAVTFALTAPAVLAADQAPVREVCAADFAKFCPGQDRRSDAGRTCLRLHRMEFSQPCQAAMAARRLEMMAQIKAACGPELTKFCNGALDNGDHPGRCLHDHEAELSEGCKAAFPRHRS